MLIDFEPQATLFVILSELAQLRVSKLDLRLNCWNGVMKQEIFITNIGMNMMGKSADPFDLTRETKMES